MATLFLCFFFNPSRSPQGMPYDEAFLGGKFTFKILPTFARKSRHKLFKVRIRLRLSINRVGKETLDRPGLIARRNEKKREKDILIMLLLCSAICLLLSLFTSLYLLTLPWTFTSATVRRRVAPMSARCSADIACLT